MHKGRLSWIFILVLTFMVQVFAIVPVMAGDLSSDIPTEGYIPVEPLVGVMNSGPSGAKMLLIEDYYPWGLSVNHDAFDCLGVPYDLINSSELTTWDLSSYCCIMYASVQPTSYYQNLQASISKIETFVDNGGLLIAHVCDQESTDWNGLHILPANLGNETFYNTQDLTITQESHPVIAGTPSGNIDIYALNPDYFDNWNYSTHGYFTNLPADYTTVIEIGSGYGEGQPTYVDYSFGDGRVLATMQTVEWGYTNKDKPELLRNEIRFACNYCSCKPGLEAEITSPEDGTTIAVGKCFELDGIVRHTLDEPPFGSSSECLDLDYRVYNPQQTISIDGPAQFDEDSISGDNLHLSKDGKELIVEMGDDWDVGEEHGGPITICCTGVGEVTIEVSLSGDYMPCAYSGEPIPISEQYLQGTSLTVKQVERKARMFEDANSSSSMPSQSWAKPADTTVLTAFIQPSQVTVGQPVTITANIANRGDLIGSYTAQLSINGKVESTRQVNVPGNGALPVEFTITKDKPGVYTVDVDGQVAYFTVVSANRSSGSTTIVYTIIGILVALAVILGVVFAMRKGFSR